MNEKVKQAVETLLTLMCEAEKENARAKANADADWKARNDNYALQGKVTELTRRLAKAEEEATRYRRDSEHWRRAVRHEQSLKKSDRVRHVPLYNSVRRAKLELGDTSWVNRERIFLKHWRRENKLVPGRRRGILEYILSENSNDYGADLTQRDATVAATVIQWLGTNCGFAFLHEVQQQIESAKKRVRKTA